MIQPSKLMQLRSTILNQNSALQQAAGRTDVTSAPGGEPSSFGSVLTDAVKAVNVQQERAATVAEAYERGDTNDIVQVMVERQKASLGFEATLQVRNKLLTAYREIMSMPV